MPSPENKIQVKNGVLLLFSGGMDSIAAAVILCERFPRVRLLTCNPPFVLGCRSLTSARVRDLRKNFAGVEITQSFVNSFPMLRRLRPLEAAKDAKSSLLICTACKLSMHLKAIEVCRRDGICYASSGIGVREQQNFPDQIPDLEARVNALYADAGIERLSPLNGRTKAEVKELLVPRGLFPRFRIPRCPVKHLQELWWFYFGWPDDRKILSWYDSQLPLLNRIIADAGCEMHDAG
ncbi:MAG: hypothetical protein U9N73_03760 [Candidatus Auribacterota bacterium]|nr:hypothetical protein [Candidatus Auribacterota bacterium]